MEDYTGFRPPHAIASLLLSTCFFFGLAGCRADTPADNSESDRASNVTESESTDPTLGQHLKDIIDGLHSEIQGATHRAQEAIKPQSEMVQNRTKEEIAKLFRWEYRVTDFPSSMSSAMIEEALTALGDENWECFQMLAVPEGTRAYCKRRPSSAINYLKYVPGL